MPKAAKGGWYGVAIGRQTGVYTTWDECSEQVKGFSKSKYKKFSTKVFINYCIIYWDISLIIIFVWISSSAITI